MNSFFFSTPFSIKRLSQVGNKSSYSDFGSGKGFLQQSDDQLTQLNNLQYGELWELFVDSSTSILPTDKIIVANENYEVRGVKIITFRSISTKKILLVKKKL